MAAKKGVRGKQHGYSKQNLLDILDKCIPIYKRSKAISFHTILSKHSTYTRTHWEYWLHDKKDADIISKFNILRDIQHERVIEDGCSGKINPAFGIFIMKTKFKYVEQQHVARLELDHKRLDLDNQLSSKVSNISINVLPVAPKAQ